MKPKLIHIAGVLAIALVASAEAMAAAEHTPYTYKARKPGLTATSTNPGQSPDVKEGGSSPVTQPRLQLSTGTVDFGSVATHTTETRQILVSNAGTGQLNFTAVPSVSGAAEFASGTTSCGSTLASGADCLTEVTFSPTAAGALNGILTFTSTLVGSPHKVTLVGSGFNPVSLTPASLPKGMLGLPYNYDFNQLLSVSNETTVDKSQARWKGSGTLPAGLSFDASRGILSGTPSTLSPSSEYIVTATYKNNEGQQTYTIKVGDAVLEAIQVSAGDAHTCAVTKSGGVKCWGGNDYGQLGDGSVTRRGRPVEVVGLSSGVVSIAAGRFHTCAVTSNGGVKCWGANTAGQLGNDSTVSQPQPVNVIGLSSGASYLASGGQHTCVVTSTGGVRCWGANTEGQLGDDTTISRTQAVNVVGLSNGVSRVATGNSHTCAVIVDGSVKCWGLNSEGQLGDNTKVQRTQPVNVVGLTGGIVGLVGGLSHTCALTNSGSAKCWGRNAEGQLGNNSTISQTQPVDVVGLTVGTTRLTSGGYHTCAIASAGSSKCWGANFYGQLGDGSTAQRNQPVSVLGLSSGVINMTGGYGHTCAITSEGDTKCWGTNSSSQLGDDTRTQRNQAVSVLP